MIVIVFLVILLSLLFFAASSGMAATLPIGEILMLIGIFLAFFGSGVYIAVVLGTLALLAGFAFSGRPFWLFMGQVIWAPSSSFVLVAVPLFLLMGEILLRTGLSEQLYKALNVWLRRWPGGLLHTNIASCAVFSAISGSSVATAATMGSVALPYFDKTNYNQRMVLGSLAAGGALGNLIPPGITFILYGLMTETSVGKLYIAAVVPSIIVCALFFVVILVHGLRQAPAETPPKATAQREAQELRRPAADLASDPRSCSERSTAALQRRPKPRRWAWWRPASSRSSAGKLSFKLLHASAEATARNTAMLGLILFGAYMLNYIMVQLRVPQTLASNGGGSPAAGLGHHAGHHRFLSGDRNLHGGFRHDHHDYSRWCSRS